MPANIKIRDASGAVDQGRFDLGPQLIGRSSLPKKSTLFNIGDRIATSLQIAILADPIVSNTNGSPVLSADPTGTAVVAGSYTLTFSLQGAQPQVSVNGGPAVNVVADGATGNTNVISGVSMVFSASVAAGNAAVVTIGSGHQSIRIAPDANGVPGAFGATIAMGDVLPLSAILNPTATNTADATLAAIDYTDLVPVMTSNTTPAGATISDNKGAAGAYYAFDGSWNSDIGTSGVAGTPLPYILTVDFGTGKTKTAEQYSLAAYYGYGPNAWILEGSLDGTTWTQLDSRSGFNQNNWGYYGLRTYNITTPAAYQMYRWTFTASDNNDVRISQAHLYGKTADRIKPGTYSYAVTATTPSGTFSTPGRTSVTAAAGGSKTLISWPVPLAGLQNIFVYTGSTGSEKLLAVLPPTATSWEDRLGIPTIHSDVNLKCLFTFDGATPGQSTGPRMNWVGLGTDVLYQEEGMSIVAACNGSALSLGQNWVMLKSGLFSAPQGSVQYVYMQPQYQGTQGLFTFGGDRNSAQGSFIGAWWADQTDFLLEFWRNGQNVIANYNPVRLNPMPAKIKQGACSLFTINWDASGMVLFIDSIPIWKLSGMTDLSILAKPNEGTAALRLGWAEGATGSNFYLDEVAGYTVPQTQAQIDARVAAIKQNMFVVPPVGTAHILPFWISESTPDGTLPDAAPSTFRLSVTGQTG